MKTLISCKSGASVNHHFRSLSRGLSKPVALASMLVLGFAVQPAHAALTFSFNYLNPGQGFEHATLGIDRQAALNSAASMLGSYFTGYTADLTFDVTSYSFYDSTLASAGSGSIVNPGTFQNTIA